MLEGKYKYEDDAPSFGVLKKMHKKLKDAVKKVEPDWRPIKPLNNMGMANDFAKIAKNIEKFKESMVIPKGEIQGPFLNAEQQGLYNEMMTEV
mmetsp:Transcript_4196/g.5192  ORF Transcript_4196/g.5192 Transcript_4196/m.5192 type:complete len:93 (+) Transcript_4196:1493-1771(+)